MRQTYGYIRVSTREQNEARQLDALYKAGVEEKRIYMDKQSGKDFDGAIRCSSRALTGWGATTTRFWSSGGSSRRRSRPPLWCWTCRFWIRGRTGI